jgi:serine/threonine protein kinase
LCDAEDSVDLTHVQTLHERLRHLDHKCIPRVIHQEPSTGHLAISAPAGVSLAAMLPLRSDPAFAMTPATVLDVACVLADVLVHAHERGRPHGQLDPSKIWIGRDGSLVVWGFGLGSGGRHEPRWVAPEAARGGRAAGDADQWALGAIIAALVTGRVPWSASDPWLDAKQGDTSHLWTPVLEQWKPLGRIVQRTLDAEPRQRFPSAHPVRQALEALADRVRQPSDRAAIGAELATRFGEDLPDASEQVGMVSDDMLGNRGALVSPMSVEPESGLLDGGYDPVLAVSSDGRPAPLHQSGSLGGLEPDPFDVETVRPTTPTRIPSMAERSAAAATQDEGVTGPKPVASHVVSPSLQPVGPAVEVGPITHDEQPRATSRPEPVEVEMDLEQAAGLERSSLDIRRLAPFIVGLMLVLLLLSVLQSLL